MVVSMRRAWALWAPIAAGLLVACGGREPLPQEDLLELELGGNHSRVSDRQLQEALAKVAGPDPQQPMELPLPGDGEPGPNLGRATEAVAKGDAREGRAVEAGVGGGTAEGAAPQQPAGEPSVAGPSGAVPPTTVPPTTAPPTTAPPEIVPPPREPERLREVRMERGENLYRIALRELGDGTRWKEIAALNGWSEERADKLPVGTMVKLPAR